MSSAKTFRAGLGGLLGLFALLAGWGGGGQPTAPATARTVPVLTAVVAVQPVEEIEQSLGRLEAPRVPAVAAETTGQVRSIAVDAGDRVEKGAVLAVLDDEAQRLAVESARATVARLEVLLENQERTVQRLQQLYRDNSVAQSMLDDAVAQARALRAQVAEATARAREAERALAKTRVESPITGIVQARRVSIGDFVAPGQAMFELVAYDHLRAYLPFPETLARRIRPGQTVELTLPALNSATVRANVAEIRPMVGARNSSIEAIVDLENPGDWMPGASVRGRVVVDRRDAGLVVPEAAVIQRPAGDVVYVVTDGIAHQRIVRTGVRRDGWAEILDGVAAGDTVVTEGAGFLTDGTAVRTREAARD